jgi:hypothetical protein
MQKLRAAWCPLPHFSGKLSPLTGELSRSRAYYPVWQKTVYVDSKSHHGSSSLHEAGAVMVEKLRRNFGVQMCHDYDYGF